MGCQPLLSIGWAEEEGGDRKLLKWRGSPVFPMQARTGAQDGRQGLCEEVLCDGFMHY